MVDVFISYKREEREAARIIADRLSELKVDVWFDAKLRTGSTFDQEIAQALDDARVVLVCWTPGAIASEWVRAEAALARSRDKLVACFLEPTQLIPPFNLTHAEDLTAWAGQEFDPGWLKILERIGQLVDRPGLSTYYAVMRPGAAVQELRAWAHANGSDSLVGHVWERIEQLEGEDAAHRIARERAEAREKDKRRRAQAARSRQLARARGLRDPRRERRRWLSLLGAVAVLLLLTAGWIGYTVDHGRREGALESAAGPEDLREFISANAWHPLSRAARERLARIDDAAWIDARLDGSVDGIKAYITDFGTGPFRHLSVIALFDGAICTEFEGTAERRVCGRPASVRVRGVGSFLLQRQTAQRPLASLQRPFIRVAPAAATGRNAEGKPTSRQRPLLGTKETYCRPHLSRRPRKRFR